MKHLSKGLIIGTLITLTGGLAAQTPIPAGRGPLPFAVFDQNGDGRISSEEFDSVHAQRWRTADPRGYAPRGVSDPPSFADFDRNGDGSLSQQELIEGQESRRMQRRQGTPGSESAYGRTQTPASRSDLGPGRGRGMGPGGGRGMGPASGSGMGPGRGHDMPSFTQFDLNGDGVLHPQEFEQARALRIKERLEQGYRLRNLHNAPTFQAIDADRNGMVSSQEFAAAQARHRQR